MIRYFKWAVVIVVMVLLLLISHRPSAQTQFKFVSWQHLCIDRADAVKWAAAIAQKDKSAASKLFSDPASSCWYISEHFQGMPIETIIKFKGGWSGDDIRLVSVVPLRPLRLGGRPPPLIVYSLLSEDIYLWFFDMPVPEKMGHSCGGIERPTVQVLLSPSGERYLSPYRLALVR